MTRQKVPSLFTYKKNKNNVSIGNSCYHRRLDGADFGEGSFHNASTSQLNSNKKSGTLPLAFFHRNALIPINKHDRVDYETGDGSSIRDRLNKILSDKIIIKVT